MLIDLEKAVSKHSMKISGVIHVGAHYGEEYPVYKRLGITQMAFFEPYLPSFERLQKTISGDNHAHAYCLALGPGYFEVEMNVESKNNGQSNSILKPKDHLKHYPDIKFNNKQRISVVALDELWQSHEADNWRGANFLNMDVQGYELEVLKGATETLKSIDYIMTEINTQELYEGCAMYGELKAFLGQHGFRLVEKVMTGQGWGDALFIKQR